METYVVGTHSKRLAEALRMSTHNICFQGEISKIISLLSLLPLLSGAMLARGIRVAISMRIVCSITWNRCDCY